MDLVGSFRPSKRSLRLEERVTKQEFVSEVARRAQLSNRDAGKAVDAFLEAVVDTLKGGGEVAFTGFGKFSTANRKERMGVNPRNPSEKVHIPAARVPKFSAGSGLKSAVKQTSSYQQQPKSPPRIERPPSGGLSFSGSPFRRSPYPQWDERVGSL